MTLERNLLFQAEWTALNRVIFETAHFTETFKHFHFRSAWNHFSLTRKCIISHLHNHRESQNIPSWKGTIRFLSPSLSSTQNTAGPDAPYLHKNPEPGKPPFIIWFMEYDSYNHSVQERNIIYRYSRIFIPSLGICFFFLKKKVI